MYRHEIESFNQGWGRGTMSLAMWPLLFAWGPLQLKTISVSVTVAVFATAFLFWRKGREEHYNEMDIFDVFLWSVMGGLLWGRVGYVVMHFGDFGLAPLRWLDVVHFPGLSLTIGLIGASLMMYRAAQGRRWDAFEMLDFWSIAMANGLAWLSLGWWFDGSAFGVQTNLPWGMSFPGVFDRHHPNQLYLAIVYVLLFWYLSKVEYRYRTFSWYRAGRNTAQTGFLISMFVIIVSAVHIGLSFITPTALVVMGVRVDLVAAVAGLIVGLAMLFHRSGRTLWRRPTRQAPFQATP